MKIVIRADADPTMGTGHVMRMLALALAAQEAGAEVALTGHVTVAWVVDRLGHERIPFYPLEGPPPLQETPEALWQTLAQHRPDWLVLDGYHFGLDCQRAVLTAGVRLLVVDDYHHRKDYAANILLNQNIGADGFVYGAGVGRTLLGPHYALLRPEFRVPFVADKPDGRRLLVTLGGGDFSSHLPPMIPALTLDELAGWRVQVIAGATPSARIAAILADSPAETEILARVDAMPELLLQTDLAISAGGSTCWELCALGVPFLTLEIAENQRSVIDGLARSGIAPTLTAETLRTYLNHGSLRETARQKGRALVDGRGAARVVAAMAEGI